MESDVSLVFGGGCSSTKIITNRRWMSEMRARTVFRSVFRLVAPALMVIAAHSALAGEPKKGRQKAVKCQVCHGYDGVGKNPEVPHIAGESTVYLDKQLKAFRSGVRKHPQMSIIARDLSDEDIADLAAYYAAIKIRVEVPKF